MEDTNLCCDLFLSKSHPFSSNLELGCTRRTLILQAAHGGMVGWAQIIQSPPNLSEQWSPLSIILAGNCSPQTATLYPIPLLDCWRLLVLALIRLLTLVQISSSEEGKSLGLHIFFSAVLLDLLQLLWLLIYSSSIIIYPQAEWQHYIVPLPIFNTSLLATSIYSEQAWPSFNLLYVFR